MSGDFRAYAIEPHPHGCPYLPGRTASYERYHLLRCDARSYEVLLSHGYRRFGTELFRPACPGPATSSWCGACVPIRIPVDEFRPSRSQRRVLRRGAAVAVSIGAPVFAPEKFELYSAHKARFEKTTSALGLPRDQTVEPGSVEAFQWSFYGGWPHALEFEYRLDGRLIGLGFVDRAGGATSSVYFCFDEAHADLSLGTLSMLRELEFARDHGGSHHYLGYVIHGNPSMVYKAEFRPSEVFDGLRWRPHRAADGSWADADPGEIRQARPPRILGPSGD